MKAMLRLASAAAEAEGRQDRDEQVVVPMEVVHLGEVGTREAVVFLGVGHIHPQAQPVIDVVLAREAEIHAGGVVITVVRHEMDVLGMDVATGSSEEPDAPLCPHRARQKEDQRCDQEDSVFHRFWIWPRNDGFLIRPRNDGFVEGSPKTFFVLLGTGEAMQFVFAAFSYICK